MKKGILLLAKEEKKLYSKQKCFHIYRKEFSDYNDDDSNLYKVRDHCHSNWKYTSNVHSITQDNI